MDFPTAVAVDAAGNVYVAGTTTSLDFPVRNALQPRIGGAPLRMSADQGKTWSAPAISDPVLQVAGSPKRPGVLIAGTTNGIYRSGDSGKSWTKVKLPASVTEPAYVLAVVTDGDNPDIFYAAAGDRVLKSIDGGVTWRAGDSFGASVLALVNSPAKPSTLYVAVREFASVAVPRAQSLYRSTDGGATWTLLENGPSGTQALACDPVSSNLVYSTTAEFEDAGSGSLTLVRAVNRSQDNGETWTKLREMPVAASTLAITAGGGAVFVSTDIGVLVSRDGGVTWSATSLTEPSLNVTVDPADTRTVYAEGNGAIYGSTDGGAHFSPVFPVRQFVQTISVVAGNPSVVFVGATPPQNVFVTKWSPDGRQMLYSTYLGGSYAEIASGIAVDAQGSAYVTGSTSSTDFPATAGAAQQKNGGAANGFVAKIASDGSRLVYATYIGGSGIDLASAIAVDHNGSTYLTGVAGSSDFPVSAGAIQSRMKQSCPADPTSVGDAFAAKLNSDGSSLVYATYLGGGCADQGFGIAVDAAGSAYVAGTTFSSDFPVTGNAYHGVFQGQKKGFLANLSAQGSSLTFSTLIGDTNLDSALAVAVDDRGGAYITGSRDEAFSFVAAPNGPGLPVSPWPGIALAGSGTAYVLKLDPAGSSRVYTRDLGGPYGFGMSVAVDAAGHAWTSGQTSSGLPGAPTPFPTMHPFQAEMGFGYVAEFGADGSLLFASLMDLQAPLALDAAGNAFLASPAFDAQKDFQMAALLTRIDAAGGSGVTVEDPQRLPSSGNVELPHPAGISAGEIVTLIGSGLGPEQQADAVPAADGTLPETLGGTSVTFDGVRAGLLSVRADRIVCIVPDHVADLAQPPLPGPAVEVQSAAGRSNAILLPATNAQVEILGVRNADGSVNSADHPAAPGSVVSIYAAGLGRNRYIPPPDNGTGTSWSGEIGVAIIGCGDSLSCSNHDTVFPEILYGGPAPMQPAGITQINFRAPENGKGQFVLSLAAGNDADRLTIFLGSR